MRLASLAGQVFLFLTCLAVPTIAIPFLHDINHLLYPAHKRSTTNIIETRKVKKPPVVPPDLLPQSQIQVFKDIVEFAAISYCTSLDVGAKIGRDGVVIWRDGDGTYNPRVYIAHSDTLGLIIGHMGTNKSSIISIAFDIDFAMVSPRPGLKWLGPGVRISKGLQQAWNTTSDSVMTKMKEFIGQYPDAGIVTTGHSLGASSALLTALMLNHHFNVSVKVVGVGLPRLGNRKFVDAVDRLLPDVHHIVHHNDMIPHIPPRLFGFHQPSGEIWLGGKEGETAYQCIGQEDKRCSYSVGFFSFVANDHHGEYFQTKDSKGISMNCTQG